MPTYSIKAPNGQTYRIDGPEGATDDQVRAQVLKQHPDAGGAAAPQRMPGFYHDANGRTQIYSPKLDLTQKRPVPADGGSVRNAFGLGKPPGPKGTPERDAYDAEYNRRFNTQWRAQRAATPAQTAGRQLSEQNRTGSGFADALGAGVRRYSFGIPEHIAAAAEAYLPSWVTGNRSNASYSNILETIRARDDADMSHSTPGAIAGGVVGSLATGRAVTGALAPVASRMSQAASPFISRVGNALEGLMTMRKGQAIANTAKLSTIGATAGATQAVGEGSDPVRGAVTGAIAAPIVGGSLKLTQVLSRPVRDFLRTSGAGRILSRFTSSSADDITARAAAYRQATGAEPTVFELLPLVDRNKILKQGIVGRDNIVEQASNAIRARAANLGPEMSALTERTVAPQRNFVARGVETDLANARGAPDPTDPALVGRATRSPTDMLELRDTEARAIMAPHEQTPVAQDFSELFPQHPQNINGTIVMTDSDPAVTAVIRSAVPGGFRAPGQGVTAGDIADMISTLRGDLGKGGIEARTAQRAIDHLTGVLDHVAPDAGAAARQMTDAYAARSRMAEGMQEGAATRLRDDVQVGTSRRQARTVRNAYDTPEGSAGRVLGQSNRLRTDLGGSPEDALKATIKMARGTSGRALAQNLGAPEADAIMAGARAQDASATALSSASQQAAGTGGGALDAEGLVQALVGLHPSSFATTKAGAIRKLLDMTYVPESRARVMVDMLFSQDPAMTRRAIAAIGNSPNGANFMQYIAQLVGQTSGPAVENALSAAPAPGSADIVPSADAAPVEDVPADNAAPGELQIDPDRPYGRQIIEHLFPDAEITEDVRDPNSELGKETPNSYHEKSQNAVDVRPIANMTFAQFIGKINDAGYQVVEAIDEVNHPSKHATGPHWHVVIA